MSGPLINSNTVFNLLLYIFMGLIQAWQTPEDMVLLQLPLWALKHTTYNRLICEWTSELPGVSPDLASCDCLQPCHDPAQISGADSWWVDLHLHVYIFFLLALVPTDLWLQYLCFFSSFKCSSNPVWYETGSPRNRFRNVWLRTNGREDVFSHLLIKSAAAMQSKWLDKQG